MQQRTGILLERTYMFQVDQLRLWMQRSILTKLWPCEKEVKKCIMRQGILILCRKPGSSFHQRDETSTSPAFWSSSFAKRQERQITLNNKTLNRNVVYDKRLVVRRRYDLRSVVVVANSPDLKRRWKKINMLTNDFIAYVTDSLTRNSSLICSSSIKNQQVLNTLPIDYTLTEMNANACITWKLGSVILRYLILVKICAFRNSFCEMKYRTWSLCSQKV